MAFLSSMQWDCRSSASDLNGGGFDPVAGTPGSDFSQQDAPQVVYTDLVIDGTTNTKVTSAATPFTSAHVGNVISVSSGTGFTVQRVQILSVTSNVATCDKSLGTLSSTGGHGNLGGAMATFTGITAALNSSGVTNDQTINIKAGTYTQTTGASMSSASGGATFKFVGYQTTHGDGGTKPLITTATNSTKIFSCGPYAYVFQNISFSNTASTRADGIWSLGSNPYLVCIDCKFDGFAVAVNGDNGVGDPMSGWFRNCEIKNCTSDAIRLYYWLHMVGCWIHNNGRDGIRGVGDIAMCVASSVISDNTGIGINQTVNPSRFGCRIVNCSVANNTSDGIACPLPFDIIIENSIIYGNGGYGVNIGGTGAGSSNSLMPPSDYNAYGSNNGGGAGLDVLNYVKGPHDVTLTANPFTDSTHYTLNSTAGGGAACKGAAFQYPF